MKMLGFEKIFLAILFFVVYFVPIYHLDEPVFIGEFSNKDGSIYAVRTVDVIASLVIFYTVAFSLIPRHLLRRKSVNFVLGSIIVVILACSLEYGLDRIVLKVFNLPTNPSEISDKMMQYPTRNIYYSTIVPGNLMVYILALLYGLSRDWIEKSRRHNQLMREKMQADIDFLRSQINPHFFFNALNNIYAITRRNKDAEAGTALMKLSGIMRYMIYDSNVETVGLDKEIEHLEQYIGVMRLKYARDDRLDIEISKTGDFEVHKIAPLILLPLVENAFKHGLTATGRGYVHIDIAIEAGCLRFCVENSRHPSKEGFRKHSGVGLENLHKRLELIYPGKHTLHIQKIEKRHTVE